MTNQRARANKETMPATTSRRDLLKGAVAATFAPAAALASAATPSPLTHAIQQWHQARSDWWVALDHDVLGNLETPELQDASDRELKRWDEIATLEAKTRDELLQKALTLLHEEIHHLMSQDFSADMLRGIMHDAENLGVPMKEHVYGQNRELLQ